MKTEPPTATTMKEHHRQWKAMAVGALSRWLYIKKNVRILQRRSKGKIHTH